MSDAKRFPTLQRVYERSMGAESEYEHKKILFIPSESYCAATIAIIEGLFSLGFKIYVPYKSNINSWFCDRVLESPQEWLKKNRIDFVLSNLHWGTRWDYYAAWREELKDCPRVLLDGDDSRHGQDWLTRYEGWNSVYSARPDDEIAKLPFQPHRWMEDLHGYNPHHVFSSQKAPQDNCFYLPFGILSQYTEWRYHIDAPGDRDIDFAAIPGDGPKRIRLNSFLQAQGHRIHGVLQKDAVKGFWVVDDKIMPACNNDPNIHSWHRWRLYPYYYHTLARSMALIYPGVFDFPQWDSKRQWEAYAAGCMVIYERPTIDMSSYPVTELSPPSVYDTYDELVEKCNWLADHPALFKKMRVRISNNAMRYFNSGALARRFLHILKENDERIPVR